MQKKLDFRILHFASDFEPHQTHLDHFVVHGHDICQVPLDVHFHLFAHDTIPLCHVYCSVLEAHFPILDKDVKVLW